MDTSNEIYVTSRSRTPSIIDVSSQNEHIFSQLPDLIQEAAVAAECEVHLWVSSFIANFSKVSSPNLQVTRVHNGRTIDSKYLTYPMFYISPSNDSGIDMVDINVTDEKLIGKFGSDLTANFADIRAHGSDAFFLKKNLSDNTIYSLCACATGYIWIYATKLADTSTKGYSIMQVQIGTFALRARAIRTTEIPFIYKPTGRDPQDGQLALLCSAVVAKYLSLRMMGQQYEYAAELAIKQSRKELSSFRVVDPGKYENFFALLLDVNDYAAMAALAGIKHPKETIFLSRTNHKLFQKTRS
ncbi:hypothetical protein B7463_g10753, partial [Scytalidium lignicola]